MVGQKGEEKGQDSGAVAKCHNALLAQIAATLRLTGTALDFVLTINALYRIVFSVITASHPRYLYPPLARARELTRHDGEWTTMRTL